jgi:hypothetical protein
MTGNAGLEFCAGQSANLKGLISRFSAGQYLKIGSGYSKQLGEEFDNGAIGCVINRRRRYPDF